MSRGTNLFKFHIFIDKATFFKVFSIFRNKNIALSSSFLKTILEYYKDTALKRYIVIIKSSYSLFYFMNGF